ncbi:MAG: DNA-binding protein WhiA [Oscillospiraceae bacterium]|nr:DNA-binding protein WhiA [Oscillospiraceae bacterium]
MSKISFSSEVKKELCGIRELQQDEQAAMLFGMFYAGKTLNGRAAIQTESPELAAAAAFLAENVFPGARYETKRLFKSDGSLYTFSIRSPLVRERFGDFSEIAPSIVPGNDADAGAFLRGVFVSCGSITDPNKEYHLEIVLPVLSRTERLRRFIEEHGIAVKLTIRGKTPVLYIKESGVIEDFLTYIGAGNHALEIMRVKIEKDFRNRVNRSVNCDSANLDKTVAASEKSRRDIELIGEKIGLAALKPELRETARLRLENPEASLSELCELFDPPISRSGLNHRLKKLARMAEELK